jgi:hypothetical protein
LQQFKSLLGIGIIGRLQHRGEQQVELLHVLGAAVLQQRIQVVPGQLPVGRLGDRKSTRLNSSH